MTANKALRLNLGCGMNKRPGWVNVDGFDVCKPDMVHDLNAFPYPWDDNSVDEIYMNHVLEHIPMWWEAFKECARIMKPGAYFQVNVPDESSNTALTYRDHHHVFHLNSFHGIYQQLSGTNAWAMSEENSVPLALKHYVRVPHKQYFWMDRFGFKWLLAFCANHLRNFIHEQRFTFVKMDKEFMKRRSGQENEKARP